ncbi:MAG: ParB/RepB/Spo0J family partition protein [Christensenellaceae bacterium]|jgi:ParB family chromosome partitioning protein
MSKGKKKSALGKGLGALIDIEVNMEEPATLEKNAGTIAIHLIDINKEQPRKAFDEEKLDELAKSIEAHGIIQPLILQKTGERYKIIAGERRYRAARKVGLTEVPAVIKEMDEVELLQVSIVENIQREDLNVIEEALAIRMLLERFSMTQEAVAEAIGRSRSAVTNLLRLLSLPEEVLAYLAEEKLSAGHARALLAIKDEKLLVFAAEHIIEEGMNVRQTEAYVKKLLAQPRQKKKRVVPNEFRQAEQVLSEKFDTKVKLTGSEKKGKIIIEYFSKEQLYALYDILAEQ